MEAQAWKYMRGSTRMEQNTCALICKKIFTHGVLSTTLIDW